MATSKTSTSALQAAIKGEKVTDRQARSALGAAVDKISSLSRRADRSREAMMTTATQVVHTAEVQGSLFLSSLAEGYLGADKLKMGGVDLRAPVGLLAAGYGLYETMSGRSGGGHALAIGNGVLGSWLASAGVQAGRTLADQQAPTTSPAALGPAELAPVQLTPTAVQGLLPAPTYDDAPFREVLLTPGAIEGDDFGRRRGGGGRRQGGGGGRGGGRAGRPSERQGSGERRQRFEEHVEPLRERRAQRSDGGGQRRERFEEHVEPLRERRAQRNDDGGGRSRRRKRRHRLKQRFLQAQQDGQLPDGFLDDFYDEPTDY